MQKHLLHQVVKAFFDLLTKLVALTPDSLRMSATEKAAVSDWICKFRN